MQHPCLWLVPDEFYGCHFEQLMVRVWIETFIPALHMYLNFYNIHASDERIRGAADMVFHELHDVDSVSDVLTSMAAQLPDEDQDDDNCVGRLDKLRDR